MKTIDTYKNYYFIGIGGIGMSALARYFKYSGSNVLGYDKTKTLLTSKLEEEDISIVYNDETATIPKELIPENTLVIFTPAVPKKLEIIKYFKDRGFTILKRSRVLGEITRATQCIAIAGTHGKTTTTSLLGHLCKYANLPATAFLGGISENYKTNFIYNGNKISIVEADEFDRSFLTLSPSMAVITSTDADHLDIYGNSDSILESFNDFANLIPQNGTLFVKNGLKIKTNHLTYSVEEKADYYADNIRIVKDHFVFDLITPTEVLNDFTLYIPGKHNIENSIAALSIGLKLGINADTLRKGLAEFKGVARRFARHISEKGKIYIDDYAHHPTEINAAIDTVRTLYPSKKLLTVFQPHLYSRTRDFGDGFAKSLEKTDKLILLDIYPARELPIDGISSEWLAEKIDIEDKEITSLSNALNVIQTKEFDVLLTVGAGDIDKLYEPIIEWLK